MEPKYWTDRTGECNVLVFWEGRLRLPGVCGAVKLHEKILNRRGDSSNAARFGKHLSIWCFCLCMSLFVFIVCFNEWPNSLVNQSNPILL